ncbi:hypothetical protein MCT03_17695 [Vibrio aestuarianus]|nr:hypothetical protein [Vibrio aestuarianus]
MSPNRYEAVAKTFLKKAIALIGLSEKIVIYGSKSNHSAWLAVRNDPKYVIV